MKKTSLAIYSFADVPLSSIVVGRRPCIIVGGLLNMYTVVHMHVSVYNTTVSTWTFETPRTTWEYKVCILQKFSRSENTKKKPKMTPANNYGWLTPKMIAAFHRKK